LPIKYYKTAEVLLVRTTRTNPVSERLKNVLADETLIHLCDVEPYDMATIYRSLGNKIEVLGWKPEEIIFNLTGGTKTMAFAAYQLAFTQLTEVFYLESEGRQSRLRRYKFENNLPNLVRDEIIPSVIMISDYLGTHLNRYQQQDFSETFERVLFDVLHNEVDEIIPAIKDSSGTLDLDLVIRMANQVGIAEVKTGRKAKKKEGIDQLNTAGGRAYLGTYTKKFLIVDCSWENLTNLSDLAEARNITVIQLPSYKDTGELSEQDKQHLIQTIKTELGGT
jgi:hypothetical protein